MTDNPSESDRLTAEIVILREEIDKLNKHRFVVAHDSYFRMLGYNFLRGLAMGLGTVVGATILVSVAAFMLAQINFIPIIGDWATIIAQEIEASRTEPSR
ncbi:DUF5665 domain-containing protein [Actibacterium lipolyticum]|uniref:Uncharacterized protein n=1 Tax=Actibacterium lipolyticum TaxID=1524263 RepID=A0A238KTZ1_9RHOB|nr:DUF5665 domain-containing protein [Actibacterium lipolyticum]SMX46269.1 hypothetical protein COL8621_03035 [Actibacterium lipolyticum]